MTDDEREIAEASRRQACDEQIEATRGRVSEGQRALEALLLYRASGLQVPEWALQEIAACYTDFRSGARPGGWVATALATPAPTTLGEAFGISPRRKVAGRRLRALLYPRLVHAKQSDRTDRELLAALGDALPAHMRSTDLMRKLRKEAGKLRRG